MLERILARLTRWNLYPPCSRHAWDDEYDDVLICERRRGHHGEHEDAVHQVRWYDTDITCA